MITNISKLSKQERLNIQLEKRCCLLLYQVKRGKITKQSIRDIVTNEIDPEIQNKMKKFLNKHRKT